MSPISFRHLLPPPTLPENDPVPVPLVEAKEENPARRGLLNGWRALYDEEFRGITTDGKVIPDLFPIRSRIILTVKMVSAARHVLDVFSDADRSKIHFPIDAKQWRRWHNTPIFLERDGPQLEGINDTQKKAILDLLKCSLSKWGYETVRHLMVLNRFSGDLIGRPHRLGEWSYYFGIFGYPSDDRPWGWHFYGHHIAINCFIFRGQLVLSPVFFGAEPNWIDDGPFKDLIFLSEHEQLGLSLMRALSIEQKRSATLFPSILNAEMPPERFHYADGRHLGGAFQDNRIVPYEGIRMKEFSADQKAHAMRVVAGFFNILPSSALTAQLADIEHHLDDTWLCWMGPVDDSSPFYYRIQSPVILLEFDHHAGILLTNKEPSRLHPHAIIRTPNGNDYGAALLQQWKAIEQERVPLV